MAKGSRKKNCDEFFNSVLKKFSERSGLEIQLKTDKKDAVS